MCDPTRGDSCPTCSGDARDAREQRAMAGWRFEEPRRLTDAQWDQWLAVLHGQAAEAPLRGGS